MESANTKFNVKRRWSSARVIKVLSVKRVGCHHNAKARSLTVGASVRLERRHGLLLLGLLLLFENLKGDAKVFFPCNLHDFGNGDRLLRRLVKVIRGDDCQARVVDQPFRFLATRALQTDDDRHSEVQLFRCGDDALRNNVAAHDAAKNVDENGRHVLIRGDELKRGCDLLGRGAAANVKKVGRRSAVELMTNDKEMEKDQR